MAIHTNSGENRALWSQTLDLDPSSFYLLYDHRFVMFGASIYLSNGDEPSKGSCEDRMNILQIVKTG